MHHLMLRQDSHLPVLLKINLTCPLLLVSWLLGIQTIGRSQI